MEHLLQLAAESNSLSVDRDSYQSSSAPTSPTKVPISSLIPSGSGGDSCDGSTHIEVAYVPQRCGSICYPELQNRVKGRSVKFPEDHSIVTGYHEAPDPYQFVTHEDNDVDSVAVAYEEACAKQNIEPISTVLEQIKKFKSNRMRAQDLILRGQELNAPQCDALEEILKRVLFRLIDLDSCNLDCDGASALFDMIEFYESASHLSIANNKSIGVIGWQSLCRTLKKTACLQYLDLSNTGLNEQILLIMGRTIRIGSHLVTLHLENAGLCGRRLAILVSSIKFNISLRELYLGDNKICSADCVQLGNLLRGNGYLNVIDLRNNFIQDIGLDHICEGLAHQPTSTSVSTVFELFDSNSKKSVPQDNGILILNLSDNQLTSRAMSRLAQTLPQCRSLIGLDLSNNPLGDEGILMLREGLFQCTTLKYLNLSNTNITCEGANVIADVLRQNVRITIIDLSDNDLKEEGIGAIRDSVASNKVITKIVILPQADYPGEKSPLSYGVVNQMIEDIDSCCNQHRTEATFDEFDSILNGHLRHDISVYNELDNDSNNNTLNENLKYYSCDNQAEMEYSDEEESSSGSKKQQLARTASLGSWERPVKSGRFSVSPVDLNCPEEPFANITSADIQINVDTVVGEQNEPDNQPEAMDTRTYSSDEDGSDLSGNETDQLTELPSKDMFNMTRLMPPQPRSFRRMSSPAISVNIANIKPKPKPNLQLKLSGNLESLDLKSSLPLSPTFFAKLDFSDLSFLRLPAEVEEIVSNLQLHNTDSEELIFQFEKFCPGKSSEQRPQECVC